MTILKKVGGILIIVAGVLLGVADVANLLGLRVQLNDSYSAGYFSGYVLAIIALGAASFFMIKFGIRWAKIKR